LAQETIQIFYEGIAPLDLDHNAISSWLEDICANENCSLVNLCIILCDDDYLLQMNKAHLDHDYYTDIITFDLSDEALSIEGELYISLDRVKDNANSLSISWQKELHRVIAHGVLHLLGYDDKTEEQKKIIRSKEDASLSLLTEF
jgi:probable rRNA maturation factor